MAERQGIAGQFVAPLAAQAGIFAVRANEGIKVGAGFEPVPHQGQHGRLVERRPAAVIG